jgi:hypothetical protein
MAQILASRLLSECSLWTLDKPLRKAATALAISSYRANFKPLRPFKPFNLSAPSTTSTEKGVQML